MTLFLTSKGKAIQDTIMNSIIGFDILIISIHNL